MKLSHVVFIVCAVGVVVILYENHNNANNFSNYSPLHYKVENSTAFTKQQYSNGISSFSEDEIYTNEESPNIDDLEKDSFFSEEYIEQPDYNYSDYKSISISENDFGSMNKLIFSLSDKLLPDKYKNAAANSPEFNNSMKFVDSVYFSGKNATNIFKRKLYQNIREYILDYITRNDVPLDQAVLHIASEEHISFSESEYLDKVCFYMKQMSVATAEEVYKRMPQAAIQIEVLKDKVVDHIIENYLVIEGE